MQRHSHTVKSSAPLPNCVMHNMCEIVCPTTGASTKPITKKTVVENSESEKTRAAHEQRFAVSKVTDAPITSMAVERQ
jgi:hypothetical protein